HLVRLAGVRRAFRGGLRPADGLAHLPHHRLAASRFSLRATAKPSSEAWRPGSRSAGGRAGEQMSARASVAPGPDDRAEPCEEQEPDEEQDDEQSLIHGLESRPLDARSPYGFPYFRVRLAGEISTLPSAFSIRSTTTSIGSPSRYLAPPRRPMRA